MPEPRISPEQKQMVAKRAHFGCEYCFSQLRYSPDSFSVEHIIPVSRGGSNTLDNLAFSCQGCNNRKYTSTMGIDPVSGEMVALYNPRHQEWSEHFTWSNDFTLIFGLTPCGRATVEKLELNREGVVNLRRILHSVGRHPPE